MTGPWLTEGTADVTEKGVVGQFDLWIEQIMAKVWGVIKILLGILLIPTILLGSGFAFELIAEGLRNLFE
ncbi:MAG: hypothetical protein HY291_00810 [Planctomycetes bacterium]|nr:hypothetical protein [Planctomycetota bacterium]